VGILAEQGMAVEVGILVEQGMVAVVGILVEQGMVAEVGMAVEVGIPVLEGRPSVQGSPAVEGTGSQGRPEGSLPTFQQRSKEGEKHKKKERGKMTMRKCRVEQNLLGVYFLVNVVANEYTYTRLACAARAS